ncbi:acyltransferase (plasmid) [Streptomyces sp. JL4002]|uniref:acyltransferase n=1 Tax=Streptomyces sp. JL4002 TaxID=3404781 RepID=UPI003B289338
MLCGQPCAAEVDGFPQHLSAEECAAAVAAASPAAPAPAPVPQQHPVQPPAPEPAPAAAEASAVPEAGPAPTSEPAAAAVRGPRTYASGSLVDQITGRVQEVLEECAGDMEAAGAALLKSAIPDAMALFKASRVGGRYERSEFPPTADVLKKRSQKGADEIWEGRPKWRNPHVFKAAKQGEAFEVTALDMNAAYLSAFKAWLPIGQLREDTTGVHDRKKSGVHLITPASWEHTDLPNPLGNRMEPGELWVTESTLRLLLDCARDNLTDAPTIHRSLVSGGTEVLLEKLRRALAEVRKNALAEGDELTVNYVKSMYSKLVSTLGESTANRDMRRPDWMHIMRAKAFANLWMKANKIHKAGLQVVEISGTDELHVIWDWRQVFTEGRDLNQVKEKQTYVLGGSAEREPEGDRAGSGVPYTGPAPPTAGPGGGWPHRNGSQPAGGRDPPAARPAVLRPAGRAWAAQARGLRSCLPGLGAVLAPCSGRLYCSRASGADVAAGVRTRRKEGCAVTASGPG